MAAIGNAFRGGSRMRGGDTEKKNSWVQERFIKGK